MQQKIKMIPITILLDVIQKDLCRQCPVYEYFNRNCKNCKNNIKEKFDETIHISRCRR